MKDFLGNEIREGDLVAHPGTGNKKAEYGLLLSRVIGLEVERNYIRTMRFEVSYSPLTISFRKTHIRNLNTCVVIRDVPSQVLDLFSKTETNSLTKKDKRIIEEWIRGVKQVW